MDAKEIGDLLAQYNSTTGQNVKNLLVRCEIAFVFRENGIIKELISGSDSCKADVYALAAAWDAIGDVAPVDVSDFTRLTLGNLKRITPLCVDNPRKKKGNRVYRDKETREGWLYDAGTLSETDLKKKIKEFKGEEVCDCTGKPVQKIVWCCPDCGKRVKQEEPQEDAA